ncbi:MAG: YfiT family bacillithiol transferase [Gemmatimonadaceae bacterium]
MTPAVADSRYPIGPFNYDRDSSPGARESHVRDLEELPAKLRDAVRGLNDEQLDTPYREGGWTVRQVVHHLPDSHMNAYMRVKLALTEDNPEIRPYDEARWAEMADVRDVPVETSLTLLDALHQRLVSTVRNMSDDQFNRTYYHTEHKRAFPLHEALAMYAWHSKHHTAHITALRERNGW